MTVSKSILACLIVLVLGVNPSLYAQQTKGGPRLELAKTNIYQLQWDDRGSGAEIDGSFWRPVKAGYYPVGDVVQSSYEDRNSVSWTYVVKDGEAGATRKPVDYKRVWVETGSGAAKKGSIWQPVPPPGYVAMGCVAQSGHSKPSTDAIRCIREDLVTRGEIGDLIWSDKGSGANQNVAAYKVYSNDEDNAPSPLAFVTSDNNSAPRNHPCAYTFSIKAPQLVEETRKIHILLFADTITLKGTKRDLVNLSKKLTSLIDKRFIGSQVVVKENEVFPEHIVDIIRRMNVSPQDTIFCYFSGHGAYDPKRAEGDPSGGHFLSLSNLHGRPRHLMRKKLFSEIAARNVRLSVLITDTCNVESTARPVPISEKQIKQKKISGLTPLEKLLLTYKGEIDISGSGRGEYGFDSNLGGVYTVAMLPRLTNALSWDKFMSGSRDTTENAFHEYKGWKTRTGRLSAGMSRQTSLTPVAFRNKVSQDDWGGGMANTERTLEIEYNITKWPWLGK